MDAEIEGMLRRKYVSLLPAMGEAERRRWAAVEARALGRGGISTVARATGMSRDTIRAGLRELDDPSHASLLVSGRTRRPGAGRRRATEVQPTLREALDRLVSPATRGDPMSALRWTSKSAPKLAAELTAQGFVVTPPTIGSILKALGYSLQSTRKTREGGDHPDRDAQFQHIHDRVAAMQEAGQPVISVDCKKKELIGSFKNAGREQQPIGEPETVNVYDFPDLAEGKAIPYGVYDVSRNEAWVSVGTNHETAQFAVNTIGQWWRRMGKKQYPMATELLITADGGGSNGSRNRAWKKNLQRLADRTGLILHVSHLPPGTSKWNKIEHRLFSQITLNWRGRPLETLEVVVQLIANTRTTTGLRVKAAADQRTYKTKIKVSDEEMKQIKLTKEAFHGEWNYTIRPTPSDGRND
jgi:hypothetical protein